MPHVSIEPSVMVLRDGKPILLGGFSPTSSLFHFPVQQVCPYSGADDVEAVELSNHGTVWGSTVVTSAPPGYDGEVPYGFGVVELTKERLRIITRLEITSADALTFGDEVELCADAVGHDVDGAQIIAWAFRKATT